MSNYLDDMEVSVGQRIRCKANLAADWINENEVYKVLGFCKIQDSAGNIFVNPSARFEKIV